MHFSKHMAIYGQFSRLIFFSQKQNIMMDIIKLRASKRMTILVVLLILISFVIIIIEEWITASEITTAVTDQPVDTSADNTFDSDNFKTSSTNWRPLLLFLSLTTFFGSSSGLAVRYRQHQIRYKSLSRFKDDSYHTLIEMNSTT